MRKRGLMLLWLLCAATLLCGCVSQSVNPLLKNEERPDRRGSSLSRDVRAELDALTGSDVIALVYPIWFGMPPAMLKG